MTFKLSCFCFSFLHPLFVWQKTFTLVSIIRYVKIPWSKFFLGSRGRIQDRQSLVPLEAGVVGMSISLMDGNTGPFHFEIKDIGLHNNPTADDEQFAYEMYKLPDFWAGF